MTIDSEWSGEGETGKHRVKTTQTQALIYTQNRLKIDHEIGAIDTRHTSYLHPASAAADRWGSLRDDCCYMVRRLSYRWPAKWWQFLYSWLVFRPLAIGSFCIFIDEWCQGTSAAGSSMHAGIPEASKFVLCGMRSRFSSRGPTGSNICSNDSALSPPLIPPTIF